MRFSDGTSGVLHTSEVRRKDNASLLLVAEEGM